MSRDLSNNREQNGRTSIWKKRRKPFLVVEVILALTAVILAVINLLRWNTVLPLLSLLITILVGFVFILSEVESRLNKVKGYKSSIGFGLIICIIPIITFIIKYV